MSIADRPRWAITDLIEQILERNIPILVDVAQAIAFSHSKGIVHRDIKPAQVMVGEYGEVLLMDWGLAIYVGDTDGSEESSVDSSSSFVAEDKEISKFLNRPDSASITFQALKFEQPI